jgi:predicted dehydrogenase
MSRVQLVTIAPGHFHAALIQKEMHPEIERTVHIYAPLDADLAAHVGRIAGFNARATNPTSWQLEVHSCDNWRERFLQERPGNVAMLSGRNSTKIDLMRLAVEARLHVLADKPWIIEADDLPKLIAIVEKARCAGLILHDMMTERYEITSILQREIVNDPVLFGPIESGDREQPGIWMESVHYLKKQVAGIPLRRPWWFFDTAQVGEALADVGTHLVDLVMWTLSHDEPIDYSRDVQILEARRWPTILGREQFEAITGLADYPDELGPWLEGERLNCFCNNHVTYSVRGVHVRLDVLWSYEAAKGGGDTHNAIYHGSRCSAVVRQKGGDSAQLIVAPKSNHKSAVADALGRCVDRWQRFYPGVRQETVGDEFHIAIPDVYRTGHEAHFAQVTAEFLRYLKNPESWPVVETAHLLAKYYTTTQGVALARRAPS